MGSVCMQKEISLQQTAHINSKSTATVTATTDSVTVALCSTDQTEGHERHLILIGSVRNTSSCLVP